MHFFQVDCESDPRTWSNVGASMHDQSDLRLADLN
jgi:hypothetical protein